MKMLLSLVWFSTQLTLLSIQDSDENDVAQHDINISKRKERKKIY